MKNIVRNFKKIKRKTNRNYINKKIKQNFKKIKSGN